MRQTPLHLPRGGHHVGDGVRPREGAPYLPAAGGTVIKPTASAPPPRILRPVCALGTKLALGDGPCAGVAGFLGVLGRKAGAGGMGGSDDREVSIPARRLGAEANCEGCPLFCKFEGGGGINNAPCLVLREPGVNQSRDGLRR